MSTNVSEIQMICAVTRRKGTTDYLLRAAINNPNVTIVSVTSSRSGIVQQRYYELLSESPWYNRLKWFLFGKSKPIFISLNNARHDNVACSRPLIFDRSCFAE